MTGNVKKFGILMLSAFILLINTNITKNYSCDIVDEAYYLRNNVQLEIGEFQQNNTFLSTLLTPDNLDYQRVRSVVIKNEELYSRLNNSVEKYNKLFYRHKRILSKEGFVAISKESIESLRKFDNDKDGIKDYLYKGYKEQIIKEKEGEL